MRRTLHRRSLAAATILSLVAALIGGVNSGSLAAAGSEEVDPVVKYIMATD